MRLGVFLSLLSISVVASCVTKRSVDANEVRSEFVTGKEKQLLFSVSSGDSVESSISYRLYADPKHAYQDSVNALIGSYIWNTVHFEVPKYTYSVVDSSFFRDQLRSFQRDFSAFERETGSEAVWSYEADVSVRDEWEDVVLVSISIATYTGGAHPNGFSEHIWKKKSTGRDVSIEEWITDRKQFVAIAEQFFRKARGIEAQADLTDEGFWFDQGVFVINNNFSIDQLMLRMEYNPYEIAPYVMGPTVIEIPLERLKGCFHLPKRKQ